jgi:hypothetical protein
MMPASQILGMEGPQLVYPGQQFTARVHVKNVGDDTWTAAGGFALGSASPQDNFTWGLHRVSLPHDVAPQQQVTFEFIPTASPTQGVQTFAWRMVQDGGAGWFGPEATMPVDVSLAVKIVTLLEELVNGLCVRRG